MFPRAGQPTWLHCGTVCRGGVQEGTVLLDQLSVGFQSLPLLPTSKLGPSGADSQVRGFVHILGLCGSPTNLLWGWEFLLVPWPPQVFSVRGFEALFPGAGALGCIVYLALQLFLPVYPHTNVGLLALPAATLPSLPARLVFHPQTCCESSTPGLPVSAPPTCLYEYFFNSLVVRLPYNLIFWQFWLFFVFKFVVVLLFVWGGRVYLPTPPSWPVTSFFKKL